MDYEKLYKEALERARQFSEHPLQEDSSGIVEYIFPELKESEDERIRKEIIKETKGSEVRLFETVTNEEFIAWLERQSEKKPQRIISAEAKEALYNKPSWSEEDENIKEDIILNLQENYRNKYINERTCLDEIHWLKSLKERIGG